MTVLERTCDLRSVLVDILLRSTCTVIVPNSELGQRIVSLVR